MPSLNGDVNCNSASRQEVKWVKLVGSQPSQQTNRQQNTDRKELLNDTQKTLIVEIVNNLVNTITSYFGESWSSFYTILRAKNARGNEQLFPELKDPDVSMAEAAGGSDEEKALNLAVYKLWAMCNLDHDTINELGLYRLSTPEDNDKLEEKEWICVNGETIKSRFLKTVFIVVQNTVEKHLTERPILKEHYDIEIEDEQRAVKKVEERYTQHSKRMKNNFDYTESIMLRRSFLKHYHQMQNNPSYRERIMKERTPATRDNSVSL